MPKRVVVAAFRKRRILPRKPAGPSGDLIFNTNPQWPGEITGDCVTLTTGLVTFICPSPLFGLFVFFPSFLARVYYPCLFPVVKTGTLKKR